MSFCSLLVSSGANRAALRPPVPRPHGTADDMGGGRVQATGRPIGNDAALLGGRRRAEPPSARRRLWHHLPPLLATISGRS